MPGIRKSLDSVAGWVVVLSCLGLPSLAAAQAGCGHWNVSNQWAAIQSNDTAVHFSLQQDGTVLKGSAYYGATHKGDMFSGDDYYVIDGSVDGTIKGDDFDVTVYWNNGTTGAYTGKVGPQGRIEGSTYDKQHPQTMAMWHSDGTAECMDNAGVPATTAPAPAASSLGLATAARPAMALGRVVPPAKPPVALGRVAPSANPNAGLSICEVARSARARNSPAAASLERQCAAQPAPPAQPAAPQLDGAWRSDKSARGQVLASQDPLATELRNAIPDGKARNGFDYGMAVAEGDTANGPGKQAIQNALDPDEQFGFGLAVQFSIDRNANAELAAKGAAIAQADPDVAAVRDAANALAQVAAPDAPAFYKLGFDIATGLFGDPALGGVGNAAMDPGSLKIRNSLAPGHEQSGFDDAARFQLARKDRR
ncbi:hypothetical protein [Cognatiluteimonas profundi]|uniref:hypothetical protein n=1 Tax=Cognatiluteimonas profundi TaxID=2594501 RepID=UPI00131B026F|nr:hypothetical protein [Lysobacter profundi]